MEGSIFGKTFHPQCFFFFFYFYISSMLYIVSEHCSVFLVNYSRLIRHKMMSHSHVPATGLHHCSAADKSTIYRVNSLAQKVSPCMMWLCVCVCVCVLNVYSAFVYKGCNRTGKMCRGSIKSSRRCHANRQHQRQQTPLSNHRRFVVLKRSRRHHRFSSSLSGTAMRTHVNAVFVRA